MLPTWHEPAQPLDPAHFAAVRRPLLEAETLPTWAYTSPSFYRREVERIFGKVWNFVGHVDQLPEPGSYVAFDFVGVPVILARGKDGRVRAFANSCRHRGAKLLEGCGTAAAIRCPYHSWTYDLEGRLRGAAQMEDTVGFDKANFGLDEFRVGTVACNGIEVILRNATTTGQCKANLAALNGRTECLHGGKREIG